MAKKVVQVHDKDIVQRVIHDLPDIPGLVFSWQNPEVNEKMGWRIWRPVHRDEEMGEQVASMLGDLFDKFQGLNQETNYFMKGRDCMLAYTSREQYDAQQAEKQAKADAQMLQVEANAEDLRRNVLIQNPMGRK